MPLIEHRQNKHYSLAIWETTEEPAFLWEKVRLGAAEETLYDRISHDKRKKEWLAVRLLLQDVLQISSEISYNNNRKPSISGYNISISHSNDMVTVIVSDFPCAIDIERVTPRVAKIAHRAFSEDELKAISTNEELTTYWCTKEAVFKLYGKGEIDLKKDIKIEKVENFKSGSITCNFLKKNVLLDGLILETFGDYKLVWIVDEKNISHGF